MAIIIKNYKIDFQICNANRILCKKKTKQMENNDNNHKHRINAHNKLLQ